MSAPCSTVVSTISLCSSALSAMPALALCGEDGVHLRHIGAIERHVEGVDEVLAQVGNETAQRIGEARPRRHQHLGNAELARQRHRVQRSGAAEGKQREIARIEAARQRHRTDGAGHMRVAEPDDGRRRRIDVDAERLGELVAKISRTCATVTGLDTAADAPGRAGPAPGWRR
jgi:hypothetical protein